MPKDTTFKISKRGEEAMELTFSEPENLDDPRWAAIVDGDVAAAVHNLALQSFVIKKQAAGRAKFSEGLEAVQAAVSEYVFGIRRAGTSKKSVKMGAKETKKLKFSPEQLAALAAAGVSFDTE